LSQLTIITIPAMYSETSNYPKKHKQEFLAATGGLETTTTTTTTSKDGTKSLNGKTNTSVNNNSSSSNNVTREMASKAYKIPHKVTQQLPDGSSYPIPACL
jgi:hypothetical protein